MTNPPIPTAPATPDNGNQAAETPGAARATWQRSIDDPNQFWLEAAQLLDWQTPPTVALEQPNDDEWTWFPDGTLNASVNALDRHVAAGHGDRTAVIYDSAMTGSQRSLTYAELLERTAKFAGVLRDHSETSLLGAGVDFAWFPLSNPGIISIPLGFFLGWLGSVTSRQREDPRLAAEMEVRALTGHGAEPPVHH